MPRSPRAPAHRRATYSIAAAVAGVVFLASIVGYASTGDDSSDTAEPETTTSSAAPESSTTTTSSSTTASATSAPARPLSPTTVPRTGIEGFGSVTYTVTPPGGDPLRRCGLLADTPERQSRGMMGQQNMGGHDGMLFPFPADTRTAFYMANVPVPLSIAFFDGAGRFVSAADMPVCDQGPQCPRFSATGPFRLAIEVLQGGLDDLGLVSGATVNVLNEPC